MSFSLFESVPKIKLVKRYRQCKPRLQILPKTPNIIISCTCRKTTIKQINGAVKQLFCTDFLHTIVKHSYKTVQRRIPHYVEEETNLDESHGLIGRPTYPTPYTDRNNVRTHILYQW